MRPRSSRKSKYSLIFFLGPCCITCLILVPQPGIKPALGEWSLNHWTTREIPLPPSFCST